MLNFKDDTKITKTTANAVNAKIRKINRMFNAPVFAAYEVPVAGYCHQINTDSDRDYVQSCNFAFPKQMIAFLDRIIEDGTVGNLCDEIIKAGR
jgi:hypothetical protein